MPTEEQQQMTSASAPAEAKAKGGKKVGDRAPVGQSSGFDDPTKRQQIMTRYHAMKKLEEERSEVNAKINAERKALFAMGLNPHAVRHHYGLWKLEEEKRIEYGRSMVALNKAAGTQLDLDLPPAPKRGRGRPPKPKATGPKPAAEIAAQAPEQSEPQEPEQPPAPPAPQSERPPLRSVSGNDGYQYPPSRFRQGPFG